MGELTVLSDDVDVPPVIKHQYLASGGDVRRLSDALDVVFDLLSSPAMRRVVRRVVTPRFERHSEFAAWARATIQTSAHASSTCRMGARPDDGAVTDETGKVFGVEGLRIADTSIMPRVTSRGPNATAVMIGEHVAAMMLASNSDPGK